MTNAMIQFNAHRLQMAHAIIEASDDEMEVSGAEFEVERRIALLEAQGYKVFADAHDVMLMR